MTTIGRTLGKYEIQGPLARSRMADVYKGWDEQLRRAVAIKVLKPERSGDPGLVKAFSDEARNAARLSHPHIVNIHEVGEQENLHFIVMEYVPGRSLQEEIRRSGALPLRLVSEWFRQICEALNYAHRKGFVHSDVKPSNILLDRDGRVKLIDFGIARAMALGLQDKRYKLVGTPRYMSPEHVQGRALDHRSDIYSLGVVLFEMLTGRVPFAKGTSSEVMRAHVTQRPPLPSTLRPELPKAVDRVVQRALSKNPEARYQNALQMARDVTQVLQPGAGPIVTPQIEEREEVPQTSTKGRSPWLLFAVAGAVVLLAVAWMWRGRRNPEPLPVATATTAPAPTVAPAIPTERLTTAPAQQTSAPSAAPTSTLAPTQTRIPATATRTVPASSPTSPLPAYAAPQPLEPREAEGISGRTVGLSWSWEGTLRDDEWFDLWVWPRGEAERSVGTYKESEVEIYPPGWVGIYYWKVRIVRGEPGKPDAVLSPFGETRTFDFEGYPRAAPQTAPTSIPAPYPYPPKVWGAGS